VAVDTLLNSGLVSGAAPDATFFWLWGLPFAVAAVFLAWYALTGDGLAARRGCLGAVVAGVAVLALLFAYRVLRGSGALEGIVLGSRVAPLASVVGLAAMLVFHATGGRRSR